MANIARKKAKDMVRIFLTMIFVVCGCSSLYAQHSMREVWLSMPETLFPYLQKSMRNSMLDNVEQGSLEKTDDLLDGTCCLERLTDDYLCAQLGTSVKLELKLFEAATGDTLLCVVKTLTSTVSESELYICPPDWSRMKAVCPKREASSFVVDSLSAENLKKAMGMLDPLMVYVSLLEHEPFFIERVSPPILADDERQWLTPLLVSRKRALSELLHE